MVVGGIFATGLIFAGGYAFIQHILIRKRQWQMVEEFLKKRFVK